MMGRGHSLSGAAVALGAAGAYTLSTGETINPALLAMGTAALAGAALLPDLDSYTATVTKSFGVFGRVLYYITNAVSLTIYNVTSTRKDDDKENGHRTFTHTIIAAILFGLGSFGLTSIPGELNFFGIDYTWGQFNALIIMAFLLHLATAGIFAPQIKKAKNKLGVLAPYILMAFSLITTFIISRFLPVGGDTSYQWLAIVVGVGVFVHILGDTITKMGTPLLWPIKISGKRWYDVSLPAAIRITAGGTVENAILIPAFTIIAIAGIVIQVLAASGVLAVPA